MPLDKAEVTPTETVTKVRRRRRRPPHKCHIELNFDVIKRLMTKRGIKNRDDLSKLTDISPAGLYKLFNKKHDPSLPVLSQLCKVLKCQPGDILRYEGPYLEWNRSLSGQEKKFIVEETIPLPENEREEGFEYPNMFP